MSDYFISQVYPSDKRTNAQVDALLEQEGIRRDANLDYTCVMFDNDYHAIATGSCFGNTLRCMAVDHHHQGEGLMNEIVSHLVQYQYERGNLHLFLYTKCSSAKFFGDLGFYEIARIEDQIVFMENRKDGFSSYLDNLARSRVEAPKVAAIVMNANPFTLGHQYLVEKAAAENDLVHLFMVSEDASLFPYAVRKQLIQEGTRHLSNLRYHDSGPYIISQATFPSYFQKDAEAVIASHANLDLAIFTKIAHRLGITVRYVGEEPTSVVTGLYNQVMQQRLPEAGIQCIVVPRREEQGQVVSASIVRKALQEGNWALVREQVPATTLEFLQSEAARPILERIRKEQDVVHY
ncbi:MAG: [citrate (pro-3S)-lyase] ligase [Acidaminococcus fermentans]|uniref:[citrate (pro-3S)-lyase] ligase n=1 Tax=uncultured Acidaminococcus sp. TaxID=352152 RepID=UPI00258E80D9|nr:[citrate (pro-3S)-lyase] ligase [Acidaminococcus fermentans]MDY2852505.1 [citrate (pro-3S)-lyase] ligase [Acidaminococcus fermentans]